jgi:hypothetical protein
MVFLYITVGDVETTITGKILVLDRREDRQFFIDSHIGL